MKRIWCFLFGHYGVSDETWGGYGWTCRRCCHNDYSIHDM